MPRKFMKALTGSLLLIILISCAASQYGRGKAALDKENYVAAIQSFLLVLKENQNNADAWRDLGIAYYKQGNFEKSRNALEKAYQLKSGDGTTIFYLGAVHEAMENYEQAIGYYKQYAKLSHLSGMRGKIEARLEFLTQKMMEQEAKQALANESAIDVSEIPDRSVAVLYFQNLGSSENLTPLQKGIADMLITDLSQVKELKVVERVKMQKLLEEMGLGQSGLVDASTAPRFGRLLGAGKMVNGSFVDLDQNNIRIDAGMIDTKSSEVQRGKEVTGELERFFRLEKNLALNIIDDMGITLSEEERKAILFIPTESMLAFLAYSKGLDYEDRGMYDQAEAQYQKAVQIDPNFTRARQKSETVTNLEDGNFELSAIEETMTSTQTVEAIDTRSRLESVATNIDRNFVPNIENREPVPEQTNSTTFGSGVPVEIEITIPR